ncbi:MAG: hypothetical protein WBO15_04360 [Gammaproteobacteria bacterium]
MIAREPEVRARLEIRDPLIYGPASDAAPVLSQLASRPLSRLIAFPVWVLALIVTPLLTLSAPEAAAQNAASDPSGILRLDPPAGTSAGPSSTSLAEGSVESPDRSQPDPPVDAGVADPLTTQPGVAAASGVLEILSVERARLQPGVEGPRMEGVSSNDPLVPSEVLVFTVKFISLHPEPVAGLELVMPLPAGFVYESRSGTGPGAVFALSSDGGLSFHKDSERDQDLAQVSHLRWRFDAVLFPNTLGLVTFRARLAETAPAADEQLAPSMSTGTPGSIATPGIGEHPRPDESAPAHAAGKVSRQSENGEGRKRQENGATGAKGIPKKPSADESVTEEPAPDQDPGDPGGGSHSGFLL